MEVLSTDVAIVGGGLGACAAALAAARLGYRVILTEETHWVGGQLTNQVVPPDEHPWIEEFGATASYRALRRGIREYYRAHLPLTADARADVLLNPGNGWVSRLCHDPRVAVAVLQQMMAPHQLSGRLFVLEPHRPVTACTDGDRVTGVVVRGVESGQDSLIEAPFFIDATPYGDLLDLAGVEHVVGAESQAETGEPHAVDQADPRDQQAITVCFAIEHLPGEDHTIDKPPQYGFWREFRPPGWPGPLLGWTTVRPETGEPLTRLLFEAEDDHPWWRFRRILDRTNFEDGFARSDMSVVNWPQNDYWFGPVVGVDSAEQARHMLEPEEPPVDALVAEGVELDRHLVGFSVREPGPAAPDIDPEDYYALLANSADFMVERYDADVVFVPMERTDVQHSHGVVAHMRNAERAEILRRRYSPGQVLALMGRFDFAVGMRLHFLIFAALRGTPFAALPYATKVAGLLEDLQVETPPLGSINIGQLIASIDHSWDTRDQIRAKISQRLPQLKHRAAQTNQFLMSLLREQSPGWPQEASATRPRPTHPRDTPSTDQR